MTSFSSVGSELGPGVSVELALYNDRASPTPLVPTSFVYLVRASVDHCMVFAVLARNSNVARTASIIWSIIVLNLITLSHHNRYLCRLLAEASQVVWPRGQ